MEDTPVLKKEAKAVQDDLVLAEAFHIETGQPETTFDKEEVALEIAERRQLEREMRAQAKQDTEPVITGFELPKALLEIGAASKIIDSAQKCLNKDLGLPEEGLQALQELYEEHKGLDVEHLGMTIEALGADLDELVSALIVEGG